MKMFAPNATDCYKVGHKPMYHEDSQFLYSNLTPRSDRLFNGSESFDGKMVWFGVQGFCMEVLVEMWDQSFFSQPKEKVVGRYKRRMASIFGPNVISDEHIAELHDLGYLPLHVMALPEGTRVPMGIPVLTINNTVEGYGWLVNYLESVLSAYLWKMSTSATIAFEYRRTLERYSRLTGGAADFIPLQVHDFSFRGMSGPEDAARTGAGHILSFIGSDNIPAMDYLEEYYGAGVGGDMIATSVPASEHSVSSSNILFIERAIKDGKYNGPVSRPEGFDDRMYAELIFMHKMITELFPKGIVSYVADTYDYWAVVTKIVPALKDEIMARKPDFLGLNKLVIRPDSGDPVKIICGDPDAEIGSAEYDGTIEILWDIFGGTVNEKGYKTLDEHIGLIYGDSITLDRQERILAGLAAKGFSSDNVVFGAGSYTYQYVTRDTFGTAMKATFTQIGEEGVAIFKDPKTGAGKKSAKGLLAVVEDENGELKLLQDLTFEQYGEFIDYGQTLFETVFIDGEVDGSTTLNEIKARLVAELKKEIKNA